MIGLTSGRATNASRPSAASATSVATTATIRADGRLRSYASHPTANTAATIENDASGQLIAWPPA